MEKIKQLKEQYLTPTVKRNLEIAILFFSSILAIVSLIFSYISFKETEQKVNVYQQIVDNLRQSYFTEFRLSNKDCDTNEFSLFKVEWDGALTGCDCSKSSNLDIENIMYRYSCNISTQYGCTSVYPISKRIFNFLAMDSNKKEVAICGKRANNFNQFHRIIGNQSGVCQATQKQCGNPTIPSTVICVKTSDPCPIYSFKFYDAVQTKYDSSWGYLKVNDNIHFYYDKQGNNADALPVSQLVTTSGPGPCQFYPYKQTKTAEEYLLFEWNRESCDTDTFFIYSDLKVTEKDLYYLNLGENEYEVVSNYTGFDIQNSKELYKIYYKPFIPWTLNKRYLLFSLVDFLLNIQNLLDAILYTIYVTGASVGYLAIYVNFQLLYYIAYLKYAIDDPLVVRFKRIKLLLSFLFKIAAMYVAYSAFKLSGEYKDVLEDVAKSKPTEDIYVKQFTELSNFTSKQIWQNNLVTIITTTVNMAIDIATVIMELLDYRKRQASLKVQPTTIQSVDQQSKQEIESLKDHNQNGEKDLEDNQEKKHLTIISLSNIKNNYPQFIKSSNGKKTTIVLSDKGLVFENGLLKTRKDLSSGNL